MLGWVIAILALLLDRVLGEPSRWHPLVGLGHVANRMAAASNSGSLRRLKGALCVLFLILGVAVTGWGVHCALKWVTPWLAHLFAGLVLYLCIGRRSLFEHALAIVDPLQQGDLTAARSAVARIVSRDTDELDAESVARATVESVLENASDALFASLFWFAVGGVPLVLAHRVANTLDAMWGYRSEHWREFGWAAARLDDVLNWLPARFAALGFVVVGGVEAWRCWQRQAVAWDSPNAGPVMAAGAGALGVRLGGGSRYHGGWKARPELGPETACAADAQSIKRALALVNQTLVVGLLVWLALGLIATVALQ